MLTTILVLINTSQIIQKLKNISNFINDSKYIYFLIFINDIYQPQDKILHPPSFYSYYSPSNSNLPRVYIIMEKDSIFAPCLIVLCYIRISRLFPKDSNFYSIYLGIIYQMFWSLMDYMSQNLDSHIFYVIMILFFIFISNFSYSFLDLCSIQIYLILILLFRDHLQVDMCLDLESNLKQLKID